MWLDHLTSLCLETNVFKESPEFDGHMKSLSHKSQLPEVLFCSGSFLCVLESHKNPAIWHPNCLFSKKVARKIAWFPRSSAQKSGGSRFCLFACLLVCLFAKESPPPRSATEQLQDRAGNIEIVTK